MTDILRLSLPLTVWIAAFSAIYGVEGVVCSAHWSDAGLDLAQGRAVLIAAWILAIAAQIGLIFWLRRPGFAAGNPWLQRVSLILAMVALVATLWSLLPAATATLCL